MEPGGCGFRQVTFDPVSGATLDAPTTGYSTATGARTMTYDADSTSPLGGLLTSASVFQIS